MGLRHLHYAQVFALRPAIDFVEVHAENFLPVAAQSRKCYTKPRSYTL
jgi:uncharacterized protein (UPF0276 family)